MDRTTSAAEVGGGAPDGWRVRQWAVSTSSDILRIGDVKIQVNGVQGQPYNNATGTDTSPPNPIFVGVFPALGADSFITTPGGTAIAGNAANPLGTEGNSWFDTTNDGPQSNFVFAQLTLPPGNFTFTGVVSVLGDTGDPEVHPFSFPIPEPTSGLLAGLALLGLGFRRRS